MKSSLPPLLLCCSMLTPAAALARQAFSVVMHKDLAGYPKVDGDPSRRISDIRRTILVLKGGVAYAPAGLYEAMGFKPFAPAATIVSGAAPR